MEESDIKQYSTRDLIAMRERGETVSTKPDAPTTDLDDAFWDNARVVMPTDKTSIHLRVDSDVLEWFRSQGRGHLTRMNAVLRSYVEAHKRT